MEQHKVVPSNGALAMKDVQLKVFNPHKMFFCYENCTKFCTILQYYPNVGQTPVLEEVTPVYFLLSMMGGSTTPALGTGHFPKGTTSHGVVQHLIPLHGVIAKRALDAQLKVIFVQG